MNLGELLLAELKKEAASTEKLLMAVPDGKNDWKPHEKSFPLGRLATHVAEMPHWLNFILETDERDMIANPFERHICADNKELMEFFAMKRDKGFAALEKATNEQLLNTTWTFRAGEHIVLQASRYECIRSWMFNHQYHHRGQLSVYLRLLDIPIPGMYGPSADDRIRMQAAQK